ncbi:MAG: CHC2 zinc finger domain-containing protein [Bacteroidales bacterium]|nr:CHC2 zinc finger domain-containing protein [Bacteroidales bacterium]
MLTEEDIQKLQDLSIEQVAEALQISVRHHKAICPFHDDSRPSLTFSATRNRYRCFVCDAGGGTIDLVMHSQGWRFYESCIWLARRFGITLSIDMNYFQARALKPQPKPRTSSRECRHSESVDIRHLQSLVSQPVLSRDATHFLIEERRLCKDVVHQLGITSIDRPVPMTGNPNGSWFNAPSLLIPYRDTDGRLLSVQARYLGSDKSKPRFQFPKGNVCGIFNLPVLTTLGNGEPLFITEGVTDCMAMLSAGHKAIAIPSATLLKPKDVELLKGLNLHMFPDADEPGERLFFKIKELLPQITHHQLPSGIKDFGQLWASRNVKC